MLGALFPQGDLPVHPIGVSVTKGYDEHPGMTGPVMGFFDSYESSNLDLGAATISAFVVAQKKLCRFHDLSILNFLVELRDLKRMAKHIRFALASYKEILPLLQGEPQKAALARLVGDTYLSYKFGYAPLCRDLITILRLLRNMHKRIKSLLRRVHKIEVATVQLHAFDLPPTEDLLVYQQYGSAFCDNVLNYEDVPGQATWTKTVTTTPKACIKYTLFCEDLSRLALEVRSYMEAFGIRWDPAVIWNAIPFSFIIDWVWDVSAFLEGLAKPTLPVKLRILDMCIMHKMQGNLRVSVEHVNADGGNPAIITTRTQVFNIWAERFRRWIVSPSLDDLDRANWDDNVIDKTLLGASLVTTSVVSEKARLFKPQRMDPAVRTLLEFNRQFRRNRRRDRFDDPRAA